MQGRDQTQSQGQVPVDGRRSRLRGSSWSSRSSLSHDTGRLTASNLQLHDDEIRLEQEGRLNIPSMSSTGTTWAEQATRNDWVRRQYSTLSPRQHAAGPRESPETQSNPALDHDDILGETHRRLRNQPSSSNPRTLDENMSEINEWFGPQRDGHGASAELPLERFLTASRADSPTLYSRPAIQQMGVHDGILDAMQRQSHARRNVAMTASNRKQAGTSVGSLDVEMEH